MTQSPWKILIIDDSLDDRIEVRRLLRLGSGRCYSFVEAETGAAGLRALREDPPNCVVLDYYLPDMTAPEALGLMIRPDGMTCCPVVVLTGGSGEGQSRVVLQAGAQDFLGKASMTDESLTWAVENALERWGMFRELRTREAQLRLVLEATNTGLWTWDMRTDAVTWSPECYRIHGIAEGAFACTGEAFFALVHPDDRQRVQTTVRSAVSAQNRYECTFRIVRPDGGVVWVENRGRASYDADGQPQQVLGTLTDVTALKRAQEFTQVIVDGATMLVYAKDLEGRYILTNQAWREFTGLSAAEAIGVTDDQVFGPDVARHVRENDHQVAERKERLVVEESALLRGQTVTYLSSKFPLISEAGQVYAVCGVSTDITELKRTQAVLTAREDALQNADRHKDEFLATLAHELRNPLSPIRMDLQLLKRLPPAAPQAVKTRDRMERQVEHLVRLMDDLLDLSRVGQGKITLQMERVSLQDLANVAVETCRPTLLAKGHTLALRFPQPPLVVYGDRVRLVQVFTNLLTNAAKYTDPGGHIRLQAREEKGAAAVEVSDTGVGIAPEVLPTIWDLFTQVRDTLDRSQGGLGIGLSLVRKLVGLHGGTITADSPGVGQGSTFTVMLPFAAEAAAPAPVPTGASALSS